MVVEGVPFTLFPNPAVFLFYDPSFGSIDSSQLLDSLHLRSYMRQ